MANHDLNAEMAEHARAAAEMVSAEFGHQLDFSEPTIGAIEAILNGFWEDGDLSDELLAKVALLFGSYIGEMIRHSYPEAVWKIGSLTPDVSSPVLTLDEITLYPISWCYKRLCNGPDDSVVKKYLGFRDVVSEQEENP